MKKEYDQEKATAPSSAFSRTAMDEAVAKAPPVKRGEEGTMNQKGEFSQADQAYLAGLMKLLHSKETAPQVDAMLQSAPPEKSVPQAAMVLNDQMEMAVTEKSWKPTLDTLFAAGAFLVNELITIGNTGGFFKVESEEQAKLIFETTFKSYITKGLKDGSIDPVELQAKVEPLMTESQRTTGLKAAYLTNTKMEPDQQTVMESYGAKRERQGMLKGGQKK